MNSVMPPEVSWIREAAIEFNPNDNTVTVTSGARVHYSHLVVCPGLKLDWDAIEGLPETLGRNGVTSNYHPMHASYTWQLVQELESGKAIFTQPPMPIKCAGAPQKAMYLSADYWLRTGRLDRIDIAFCNAGPGIFGVKEYVPALELYLEKYGIEPLYGHNLKRVDGDAGKAWFERTAEDGGIEEIEKDFDMLHVCPPQTAPDFIRSSPLADEAGWVDVDKFNLRHKQFDNVWSLGDAASTPNAKTAAAVRVQAPIVAANILATIHGKHEQAAYNGYGSCPLTVEKGKIILAEFGYDGKLLPTFPKFLLDGSKPTRQAWFLKEKVLPKIYWDGMLKGHEWLVTPEVHAVETEK